MLAAILAATVLMGEAKLYPRAFVVDELNKANDKVICVDAVGYEWEFYGTEDYEKGDLVVAIMSDNGTPETIFDDYFVNIRFGGYNYNN